MESQGSLPHSQVFATCPCPEPDQSSPLLHPTSWSSILILSSHLSLGLPRGLFLSVFPTKTLYTSPLPYMCYMPRPSLLVLTIRIIFGEEYRLLTSPLCSFLHSSVTSSLLVPHILLSTLFSNILNLRSSLNVSDHVSHPHKPTGKIIVLYFLIFTFLNSKLVDKRFCTEWKQAFPDFNLLLISSWIEFCFVRAVAKYYDCSSLSEEFNTCKIHELNLKISKSVMGSDWDLYFMCYTFWPHN